jgi:3-methylfumaryl-CoA hydratase
MSDAAAKPFAEWIGRQTRSSDVVGERLARSYRAIFEPHLAPVPEDCAPLGIHWCLCPAIAPMSELGPDGHPAKNLDLPPVPLPRRMWAGGTLETLDALRIGEEVTRTSTITDVTRKQGRSGELWFVAVEHEYSTARGPAIRERHDIVYREAAKPGGGGATAAPVPPQRPASLSWTVETSPVFLFRYSAITFNGHRIHYDFPYVTEVEGYEGLVVHGPIQATLLFNIAAASIGHAPRWFEYRGVAPAFAGSDLLVCRDDAEVGGSYWVQGASGRVHMEARVIAE